MHSVKRNIVIWKTAGTTFAGNVNFSGTTFAGNVNFSGAIIFKANFCGVTFTKELDFSNTQFQIADFSQVKFLNEVRFSGSVFKDETLFRYTIFEQPNTIYMNSTMPSVRNHGGLVLDAANIYYLFWGNYWQHPQNDQSNTAAGFTSWPMHDLMAKFRLINQNDWLRVGLCEYFPLDIIELPVPGGLHGHFHPDYICHNVWPRRETFLLYDQSQKTDPHLQPILEPPQFVTWENVRDFILNMIDYGGCPDHRDDNQHLYYVVLPPFRRDGTSSEESLPIELNQTELGTNTTGFHRSVLDPNHSNLPLLHFACIMTRNRQFTQSPTGLDVDATTEVYSHELVESITNPEGTGIYDDTPSDCGSEVTGSSCELAEEIKNNNNEISKHALLTGILIISSSVGAELLIQKKK